MTLLRSESGGISGIAIESARRLYNAHSHADTGRLIDGFIPATSPNGCSVTSHLREGRNQLFQQGWSGESKAARRSFIEEVGRTYMQLSGEFGSFLVTRLLTSLESPRMVTTVAQTINV